MKAGFVVCVCDSSQIRRWIGMLQNADTTSKGCSTHHRVILHTQKHNKCFAYDTTLLSLKDRKKRRQTGLLYKNTVTACLYFWSKHRTKFCLIKIPILADESSVGPVNAVLLLVVTISTY